MAENEGPGEGTYTTHHQCEGRRRGRVAWPGFEPTHRAKLAARTAGGPDGARNTGDTASKNTGDTANRNTSGAAARTPVHSQQEPRRHDKPGGESPPPGLYARITCR